MLLACVADDLTGATDLADTLVRSGLRTTLWIGTPDDRAGQPDHGADGADEKPHAGVIALRTRTVPAAEAVERSRAALAWLRAAGAGHAYFKICSTFDSTDRGNIGPVADALADALGADLTLVSPAFPGNGRTVYAGHLFVGDQLLSRSGMRDHPLTPMTDPDLVAVLGRQSRRGVALLPLRDVREGTAAVEDRLRRLASGSPAHVIADATVDVDLDTLGGAAVALGLPLCVGGSGLAGGIARALAPAQAPRGAAAPLPRATGPAVIVSGSCSEATRSQAASFTATGLGPRVDVDPVRLPDDLARLEAELLAALGPRPVLVSSTAAPDRVAAAQRALGTAEAALRVESALGRLAAVAVDAGARRVLVAGGETAGAVTAALGLTRLEVGPAIALGVPWTAADLPAGRGRVAVALKSGNFGEPDFFSRALALLDGLERAG